MLANKRREDIAAPKKRYSAWLIFIAETITENWSEYVLDQSIGMHSNENPVEEVQ